TRPRKQLRDWAADCQPVATSSRNGGRTRATDARFADSASRHGSQPGHAGWLESAGRGAKRAGLAQWKLSDRTQLLAQSKKRCDVFDASAGAAIPHDISAGPDEHAGQRSCWILYAGVG